MVARERRARMTCASVVPWRSMCTWMRTADLAGCKARRRSTNGGLITVDGMTVKG